MAKQPGRGSGVLLWLLSIAGLGSVGTPAFQTLMTSLCFPMVHLSVARDEFWASVWLPYILFIHGDENRVFFSFFLMM